MLERIEHTQARIRAQIERPVHAVKNLFRHRKGRYKGWAKNTAQLFSLFGFANLMLAHRWLLNAHTQGAFLKRDMNKMTRKSPRFQKQANSLTKTAELTPGSLTG